MSGIGCPTREELTSYALGEIAEADGDAISRHLEGCERCEAALVEVEGSADRLIELCRQPAPLDRYSQEAACHDAVTRAIALGGGFDHATDDTPAGTAAEPVEEEEPVLGQMGDYKLVEELSHGGMGTVYRAIHVRLGREVALKVLPKGRNTDQRAVARFEREMAAVGKLDHPHIVRATDAGEVEGVQYLAMELIDGFDLTELVDYLGPLGVADSCDVIRQAAMGLQCAYEQGLVHRDIKPSNVMVTGNGIAKILDLGLARFHIDKQSNVELTTAGQPMGTADYMAPEQVADTHSVDIRADIYSLGCTFYKILAGQPPFGGVQYSSSFDKMMAHRKEAPPPIQEFRPDLPKKVVAVLEQMLAKDPDDRFQKPSDLAESLYPLCAGANLPEMVENAWKAAETAPMPEPSGEATPGGTGRPSSSTTAPRKKRPVNLGSTGGSSTQGHSRSQYSGFYVMPPPPKPQWGLWVTIGVLSSLLMGILGAYATTWWLTKSQSTIGEHTIAVTQGWLVPTDREAVPVPEAVSLSLDSGRPPRVRGALGEDALVAEPSEVAGLTSWTMETVGHRTPILCAAVSPDGKALATGSGEGAVRIWDLQEGTLNSILIYPGRDGAVRALAWAPGGGYLAAAYEAGILMIWDVKHGTVLPDDFTTQSRDPGALDWSPDGTVLAYIDKSPGQDEHDAVMLWDFKSNRALQPMTGAVGRLNVVAFSPNGQKLAAGGEDMNVHVWEVASSRETGSYQFHSEPITALAWSPCATMIASSCGGGESYQGVVIWDVENGSELGDLSPHAGGDRSLVWLVDPPTIVGAGGGRDGRTRYYDLDQGRIGPELKTGKSLLCRVGAQDKAILIDESGAVCWCERTGLSRAIAELPLHPGPPSALAVAPDGKTIASGTVDGKIRFIDAATGDSRLLETEGAVRSLVYSPDMDPGKSKLAVTTETWSEPRQRFEPATSVYDVEKRNELWTFDLDSGERIDGLAWSPDGATIATAGDSLKIWDVATGNWLNSFEREAHSVTWIRDGTVIALGSESNVELVDAKDGSDLLSFAEATDSPRLMAWSKEADRMAVTSGRADDPEIVLLAADSSVAPKRISVRSLDRPVAALGWQADGKVVLTGSLSETCRWDIDKGERVSRSAQGSQLFSTDGTLAMLGGPSMIRVQDPQKRELVRTVLTLSHRYAVISPNGHYDGSVQSGDIVYVVQGKDGQATLKEKEFAEKYGWENDPSKLAVAQE